MISGRFLKSTLSYSGAGALPMLSGFILLPFYTNLLSTPDYGLLMLYVGFSLLIQVLVSYSLDAYIGAHYVEVKDDYVKRKVLLSNVAGLLLFIGLSFIIIAYLIGQPVFDSTFNRSNSLQFFPYGIMSVVTGFFNGFFKVYTYLMVFEKKPGKYFIYNFVNFVLTIAISIAGLYMYPDSLVGPMFGRLLSGVGIFLISLIGVGVQYGISFRFSQLKGLHAFCFPYMLYVALVWITSNLDRFIINDILSARYVAVFDFAVKCTLLIDFVQGGIVTAINPEVYEIWNKNQSTGTTKETNRYFNTMTALSMVVICGFMIVIPFIIPWFVKKTEYYESFALMGILAGSFATRGLYHYFLSILIYLKKTKMLLIIFAISAAIQLPATWLLTKYFGIGGTVISVLLAKIIQVVILYLKTKKYFTIEINLMKMVYLPALMIAILGLIWWISPEWNVFWYLGLLAATGAMLFVLYGSEIKLVVTKFAGKKTAK